MAGGGVGVGEGRGAGGLCPGGAGVQFGSPTIAADGPRMAGRHVATAPSARHTRAAVRLPRRQTHAAPTHTFHFPPPPAPSAPPPPQTPSPQPPNPSPRPPPPSHPTPPPALPHAHLAAAHREEHGALCGRVVQPRPELLDGCPEGGALPRLHHGRLVPHDALPRAAHAARAWWWWGGAGWVVMPVYQPKLSQTKLN